MVRSTFGNQKCHNASVGAILEDQLAKICAMLRLFFPRRFNFQNCTCSCCEKHICKPKWLKAEDLQRFLPLQVSHLVSQSVSESVSPGTVLSQSVRFHPPVWHWITCHPRSQETFGFLNLKISATTLRRW